MPDYSGWVHALGEGSKEHRASMLAGLRLQLVACEDDKDNENGPHILLVKETEFVATLVSLACDSGELGKAVTNILFRLAKAEMNRLPLLQFPGLLDALIATSHVNPALGTLSWLCDVKDEAQQVAMATNTALVDMLVANVARFGSACMVLVSHAPLCWELVLDRDRDGSHFGTIVRVQMQLTRPNMPAENR